jgi:NAD(P)-dependent dehydrogenase (short-subunit alcohol dehydrogenase family)
LRRLDCFVTAFLAMMTTQKTAIVTGGGKRVGAGIVAALLSDGWRVVAHVHHDSDTVPEGALKVVADLSDANCVEAIFAAADGPVELLVNNAARFAWDGFGEASAEEFDAHMAVNARAPMLLIDALAQRHVPGSDALVVTILDAKLAAPNPDFLSYTLSKNAAAGLTEVAARALAGQGIRVNGIAPALILPSGAQDEANYARVHALNPLGRGVEVEDVVGAVRFLIAQRAMTGQTLVIDGGQRFMALPRDVQFLEQ